VVILATTTATLWSSSIFEEFFAIFIELLSFLWIAQNLVSVRYFLKYFFSLFFIIGIFIWMVLQW
jgi:hypothetical protein